MLTNLGSAKLRQIRKIGFYLQYANSRDAVNKKRG